MFPASAGMNRCVRASWSDVIYVPRERGDEPKFEEVGMTVMGCSPRARG